MLISEQQTVWRSAAASTSAGIMRPGEPEAVGASDGEPAIWEDGCRVTQLIPVFSGRSRVVTDQSAAVNTRHMDWQEAQSFIHSCSDLSSCFMTSWLCFLQHTENLLRSMFCREMSSICFFSKAEWSSSGDWVSISTDICEYKLMILCPSHLIPTKWWKTLR